MNNSILKLQKFLIKKGKKELANTLLKNIFFVLKKKTKNEITISTLIEKALVHTQPILNVKHVSKGKRIFIKPFILKPSKSIKYTNKLIINSALTRYEKGIAHKIASEFLDTSEGKGSGVKKVNEINELVLENRAYIKYFNK